MEAAITYREGARGPIETWAIRVGKKKEIMESARGLLDDLRKENKSSQVFVKFEGRRPMRVRL